MSAPLRVLSAGRSRRGRCDCGICQSTSQLERLLIVVLAGGGIAFIAALCVLILYLLIRAAA